VVVAEAVVGNQQGVLAATVAVEQVEIVLEEQELLVL
jgi:hypothetical protein